MRKGAPLGEGGKGGERSDLGRGAGILVQTCAGVKPREQVAIVFDPERRSRGRIRDDRRWIEITRSRYRLSSHQQPASGIDRRSDLGRQLIPDRSRGKRPHIGCRIERVSDG